MAPQRYNRVKVSAFLHVGHKVSEIYAIKKGMDDGEGVSRRAGSGRKTVLNRESLQDAIRSSPSNDIPQAAAVHSSLSTPACTSVDTFAIVHALLDRVDGVIRHPDKISDPTHFVAHTKKCRNFVEPFCDHNKNKPFSSMSQSQSIEWVKQNSDNNCQTTRIIIKVLFNFFRPTRYGMRISPLYDTFARKNYD